MEKKVNVILEKDNRVVSVYGLDQWDEKLFLQIEGLSTVDSVEIHFSLTEYDGDAPVFLGSMADGVLVVEIPEFILENANQEACVCGDSYKAYAFVYVTDGESGRTEYKIILHIKARPKPTTNVPDSDKDQFLKEVRGILNETKEVAADKADKSGYTPNKYLGTDEEGNVVEKDGTGEIPPEVAAKAVEDYLAEHPIEVEDEVFVATYNVTTYEEVLEAYNQGKEVLAKYSMSMMGLSDSQIFCLTQFSHSSAESFFSFGAIVYGSNTTLKLDRDKGWSTTRYKFSDYYTAKQIDEMFGTYVDEVAELVDENLALLGGGEDE